MHHEQINLSAFYAYYTSPIEIIINHVLHVILLYNVNVDLVDNYVLLFLEYFGVFHTHYGYRFPYLTFLNERHDFHHSIYKL